VVKAALLLVLLVGCIDPIDPQWQLDHDRVIAVRATPPRIMPGERAELDALIARAGQLVSIEAPANAAAIEAPPELQSVLRVEAGRWFVEAPDEAVLNQQRARMGFAEGAAVPVSIYGMWPDGAGEPMYARKSVWLGGSAANPVMPSVTIDDAPMPATDVIVPMERDVYLSVDVPADWRVSWLTSCGQLFQDDVATSFLHVTDGDPTEGQLAVVIRDPDGGVTWRAWPIRAAN
jgi:hypothetical protein